MRKRIAALMLVVACALAVTACDSGSSAKNASPPTTAPNYVDMTGHATVTIKAGDDFFTPRYTEISRGTVVTFQNIGRNAHNVLAVIDGSVPTITTSAFQPAARVRVTFAKAGDYPFYCSLHGSPAGGMNGRVLVAS